MHTRKSCCEFSLNFGPASERVSQREINEMQREKQGKVKTSLFHVFHPFVFIIRSLIERI